MSTFTQHNFSRLLDVCILFPRNASVSPMSCLSCLTCDLGFKSSSKLQRKPNNPWPLFSWGVYTISLCLILLRQRALKGFTVKNWTLKNPNSTEAKMSVRAVFVISALMLPLLLLSATSTAGQPTCKMIWFLDLFDLRLAFVLEVVLFFLLFFLTFL